MLGCDAETLNGYVEKGESAQPDKEGQQLEAKVYGHLPATIKICHVSLLIGVWLDVMHECLAESGGTVIRSHP